MSPVPPVSNAFLPGPCTASPPAPSSLLLPAHTVRPRGHARSGRKSNNCLSAQQSSFKSKDKAKTYSDKQNWEGIASGPSAGTCRGSHPADKEDSREAGTEGSWCIGGSGRGGRVNTHRLMISDQEQAWYLEHRVGTVQQQRVVQARWDRGNAPPTMLREQAESVH